MYYFFICNFENTVKTAQEGLVLLHQLKVKDIQNEIFLKFNFNIAFMDYLYHEFDLGIERFILVK